MNKMVLVALAVIILGIGGYFLLVPQSANAPESVAIDTPVMNEAQPAATNGEITTLDASVETAIASGDQATFTMAEVAAHKDSSSCWSAIGGSVYDLTNWISKHPGGEKSILRICGVDGTTAFEGQHGGKEKLEQALASFKIGTLAQ